MIKPMTDERLAELREMTRVYGCGLRVFSRESLIELLAEIDRLKTDYARMVEEWSDRETDNLDLTRENEKLKERIKELDRLRAENRRLAGDCRRLQAVIDRLHQGA